MYRAHDSHLGKDVALKIIPLDGDIEEFKREIRILQSCESPYIVDFYGSFEKEGELWVCQPSSVLREPDM